MDKWKDVDLERMKAGGNYKARQFFDTDHNFDSSWNIYEKYSSQSAAHLRDKIVIDAGAPFWSDIPSSPPVSQVTPRQSVDLSEMQRSQSAKVYGCTCTSEDMGEDHWGDWKVPNKGVDDLDAWMREDLGGGSRNNKNSRNSIQLKAPSNQSALQSTWAGFASGASRFASVASQFFSSPQKIKTRQKGPTTGSSCRGGWRSLDTSLATEELLRDTDACLKESTEESASEDMGGLLLSGGLPGQNMSKSYTKCPQRDNSSESPLLIDEEEDLMTSSSGYHSSHHIDSLMWSPLSPSNKEVSPDPVWRSDFRHESSPYGGAGKPHIINSPTAANAAATNNNTTPTSSGGGGSGSSNKSTRRLNLRRWFGRGSDRSGGSTSLVSPQYSDVATGEEDSWCLEEAEADESGFPVVNMNRGSSLLDSDLEDEEWSQLSRRLKP